MVSEQGTLVVQEETSVVRILSFGDIMLDRNVKKRIEEHGEEYLLGKLAGPNNEFFRAWDLVSANMEGPFADERRPTSKSIAFRFDPVLIPMLKRYGFTTLSHANNHSNDMRFEGHDESVRHLRDAGITVYGSENRVDQDSLVIEEVKGKKVAFIGLNDTYAPSIPVDMKAGLTLVKEAKNTADFVIVNIHWGEEYALVSNTRQRTLAHTLIDAGVDMVIGHHPHVVEEIEIYNKKPIFYSLGNFIFDQYFSEDTQQGLGIGLLWDGVSSTIELIPLQSTQSQVTIMTGTAEETFMKALIERSRLGTFVIQDKEIHLTTF